MAGSRFWHGRTWQWLATAAFLSSTWLHAANLSAQSLDDLPLDRWKVLRETERYQLQIAEKYYRERNWKVAAAEYEKYMSLYERSDAAPYAQLKWSLAQVQLKKQNTAIKEGFQSVIDYWPDSQEAIAAGYYLGQTYKSMGQVGKAKTTLRGMVAKYPDHVASVHAMSDLIDIATTEKDAVNRLSLLKKLTFEAKRSPQTNGVCIQAARQLAVTQFESGAVDEAIKALETTCQPADLPGQVAAYSRDVIARQAQATETKAKAERTADGVVAFLKTAQPTAPTTDVEKKAARDMGYLVADIYAVSLRDPKVVETYDQILKSFGASDETLGRLAQFYKSRTKYDDARATYRRFEARFEGLHQVAYSYREQANYDPAVEIYRQLIGQDAAQANRWRAELAATFRGAKKYPEAVATYTELISADSANQNKWRWEMSTTYREAGQLREAIANFRQCDNFPENFKQMAWCHRQLKEPQEAILLYNQIVGADANAAPWALLQIGYTREEAGQKEPAIQTFQQVCKRYPKDSHASIAHAHLQSKYKISITLGGATEE